MPFDDETMYYIYDTIIPVSDFFPEPVFTRAVPFRNELAIRVT